MDELPPPGELPSRRSDLERTPRPRPHGVHGVWRGGEATISEDGGVAFARDLVAQKQRADPVSKLDVWPQAAGYSDFAQARSGAMLLLYEAGGTVYDYGIKISPVDVGRARVRRS